MLSVHCTALKGSKDKIRIWRLLCKKNIFRRFNIVHRVSSVANAHSNLRSELSVKHLKHILRDIVGGSGNLNSDVRDSIITWI